MKTAVAFVKDPLIIHVYRCTQVFFIYAFNHTSLVTLFRRHHIAKMETGVICLVNIP